MTAYTYTANATAQATANMETDKVRIATTTSAIHYVPTFPNVALTGTITTATNTANITGVGTQFTVELAPGTWIGNTTGTTAGIVKSIANATSATLYANANVAIANTTGRYNPYGVPYSTVTANSAIVPANTTLNSVIVGQGNIISYLNVAGSAAAFNVTELGMPHSNTGTSGY